MIAADKAAVLFIAFLTMVWHIDDNGILLLESFHNLCHDRVVVEGGIVIMAQHLALCCSQFWSLFLVAACPELGLLLAVAQFVVHMLSHQVEDSEVVLLLECLQAVVIVFQQSVVKIVQLGVAMVKLQFAQFWIVQEETTAEVVDGFFSLRQEFVGDEGNVVAGLSEHLWEEWIVTPFAFFANHMGGKHVLEYEAGQIPAGYYIGEFGEFSALFQCTLSRSRFHEIAVLLRVVSAVALADDEYDVRRTIAATVYFYGVGSTDKLGDLVCCQLIGIDTEVESVDR